jgi:hypothetical protein
VSSDHFLSMRHLSGNEEGLHQLALAARDQAREALEPLAFWDFGIGVQPRGKAKDVVLRNLPLPRSSEQMLKKSIGQTGTSDLWH